MSSFTSKVKQRHAILVKAMNAPKTSSRFNGIERSLPMAHSKTMIALLTQQIEYLPNIEPLKLASKPKYQATKIEQPIIQSDEQIQTFDDTSPAFKMVIRIKQQSNELTKNVEIHQEMIDLSYYKDRLSHQDMLLNDEQCQSELQITKGSNVSQEDDVLGLSQQIYHQSIEAAGEKPESLFEENIKQHQRILTIAYISFFCALLTGVMALPAYFLAWRVSQLPNVEVWVKTHCIWIMQNHFIFMLILLFAGVWFVPLAFVAWDSAMWVKSMMVTGVVFLCVAWLFLLNAFVKGIGRYLFKKSVI